MVVYSLVHVQYWLLNGVFISGLADFIRNIYEEDNHTSEPWPSVTPWKISVGEKCLNSRHKRLDRDPVATAAELAFPPEISSVVRPRAVNCTLFYM